jgi:hypothetical protein
MCYIVIENSGWEKWRVNWIEVKRREKRDLTAAPTLSRKSDSYYADSNFLLHDNDEYNK